MLQQVDTEVIVIGDSPVAKISALMLSRVGVECIWLTSGRWRPRSARYQFDLATRKHLSQLGLRLDDASSVDEETSSALGFGGTLEQLYGTVDLCKLQSPLLQPQRRQPQPFTAITAAFLEHSLEDLVSRACRCITLPANSTVKLRQEQGMTSIAFQRGEGEPETLRSRFAIVTDSADDWIRCEQALDRDAFVPPHQLLQAQGTVAPLGRRTLPQGLFWLLHPSAMGSLNIADDGHRWTYHTFLQHSSSETFARDALMQRLHVALGREQLIHITSVQSVTLQLYVSKQFRHGRLLLLGDAAYRCDSLSGESLDMGVEDAKNIAWKLAAVLQGRAKEQLLDTYEQERHPQAHKRCHVSHQCNHSAFAVADAFGIAQPLKRHHTPVNARRPRLLSRYFTRKSHASIVRQLERFAEDPALATEVQRAIAQQGELYTSLRSAHRGSYAQDASMPEVESAPQSEQPAPGESLPWMWLDGIKRHRSTYDLLNERAFVLLIGKEGEPWQQAASWLRSALPVELIVQELALTCDDERYAQLMERLQLCEDGALLLRPDGRIAWHARELSPHPKRCLLSAFEAFYFVRNAPHQRAAHATPPPPSARRAIRFQAPSLTPIEQE